ncbi:hypothetical protein PFISCL1PPCAC_14357, partial [Pristionchus fissidentatus]
MRESVYDLLCAILLGVGNMCLFMGYDTQLTIVEPVLRSVHDRSPSTIAAHAGYYGAGICTVFFTFASLASPWVLGLLGSKYTLLLGSLLFTLHLASFQYVHFIPYYVTSAAIGVEKPALDSANDLLNGTISVNATELIGKPKSFRQYSDTEIKLMYGAFAAVCLVANLLFALMPTRNVTNSIAARYGRQRVGFVDQMTKIYDTFTDVRALELTPLFCFLGLSTCFWVGAYPTSLIFTKALSGNIYLPAMYLIVLGTGEILMGIIISILSKRIKNFAQMPSLVIGAILFLAAMILAFLTTPAAATNSPTDGATPLLEPSPAIALIVALLLGMSDNSFNTSRTVLCALVIPEHIAQVYSMSKFYQSFAESILFLVAPFLSMPMYFGLISVSCLLSVFFYRRVVLRLRAAEKEITVLQFNQDMRESVYDILCAVLLGVGNMCMFMGERYDSQLTIVEPVLRSVHDRSPTTIHAHSGYYGAGICTVFFTFASIVSPWALGLLGSKNTLLFGSLMFTLHIASFQYVHFIPYYLTSATIGIGYAMFYSGHGAYITEHSTRKTIERNSALTWALATSCMIVGGVVIALTAQTPEAS